MNATPATLMRDTLAGMSFAALVATVAEAPAGTSEVELYQSWIETNAGRSPQLFAGWFNLGAAFSRQGDRGRAIAAYGNALALKPDFHAAAVNLGLSLEAEGDTDAALESWQRALQPDAARAMLLNHRGRLLERLGRLDEAEAALRQSLAADPQQPDVIQHWAHIRQRMCRWPVLTDLPGLPATEMAQSCGPLAVLALTDDVAMQSEVAGRWIARKTQPVARRLSPEAGYRHDRIRIGYLSSDFCRHAMSFLIAELFERHDRARFEVFGYCASPDDGSPVRQRVLGAFDHVRIVRDLSDTEAAAAIRADEIDILIDLNGLTAGSRLQVLRHRPAPVQATYLGFVGPVPLPELDYLFCDDFVVPAEQAAAYLPPPLAIGPAYQANDSRRVAGVPLSRAEAGLPPDRFVLCCFANHYKITQPMFAAWLAILRRAPDAVLWLATDNAWSPDALRAAATDAGIDPGRLIFAERCDPAIYLSRLRLADLFLDTFPYNGGTVASDALRVGLPLLTLCGRSFASRMAARLLDRVGAADGITHSLDAYIARAALLASDPPAYAAFRAHFSADAWSATLGDTAAFTLAFEATLARIRLRPG